MTDYTDMIMTASDTEELHSPVADTEEAIIVNTDSRDFTLGASFNPIIGVVGDHKSEVVSFAIDRFIDSHDVSECAEHKVFWKSFVTTEVDGVLTKVVNAEGYSKIEDIKLSDDDEDTVLLGWLITEDVTQSAGEVEFRLQISDYDADGQLTYRWKTIYGNGLLIKEGEGDDFHETIPKSFVSLIDQETGEKYRLSVSNGKLIMNESEG